MGKKVLVLSGSPRKNGNSDVLCDQFIKGATEVGNAVEKIFIADKKIGYCKGCYYCASHNGNCFQKDDMSEILDKIQSSDVIVMASPVYFYSIDAQMKTVIDRCVARWENIPNKEFYFIMTAGEDSETVMDGTLACFRGFLDCLDGAREMGVVQGKGLNDLGEVKNTEYMKEAYEMGKSVK